VQGHRQPGGRGARRSSRDMSAVSRSSRRSLFT
jgi:hypothetical protein